MDPNTGNRSHISLNAFSSIGAANSPGLALDLLNGRVLFTDANLPPSPTLSAIDLSSGQRSLISGPERGAGPRLPGGGGVLLDSSRSPTRALVMASDAVIAVELATGNRSHVSAPGMAVGGAMIHGALDVQGQRLIAADIFSGLINVELGTGQRSLAVAYNEAGKGPAFRARHLALDLARQLAYVVEVEHNAIMAVDLISSERTIVSR